MASTPREEVGWAIAFLTGGNAILAAGFRVAYRHRETGTMIGTIMCMVVILAVCIPIVKEHVSAKKKARLECAVPGS